LFGTGNELLGLSEEVGFSGFHLCNNKQAIFFSNNIYLQMTGLPICFQYLVALLLQKVKGNIFPGLACGMEFGNLLNNF
jgi:hypothetical protein